MADTEEDEPGTYHGVSFGRLDLIRRLPKPVWAWPGSELWQATVHGHGFVIHGLSAQSICGFYTTYVVRARTRMEAIESALRVTRRRWKNSAPGALADGDLLVEVEDVELIEGRFRWRSGAGYTFYAATDDPATAPNEERET